jgi:hypothetical protein
LTTLEKTTTALEAQHSAVLDIAFNIGKIISERFMQLLLPLLATLGGFVLWHSVLEKPDLQQLIGLGLYGAFVELPILWCFRRK